ncbi:S8 family serine peptidase [Muricoccus nepalensis]|uniref:S8 family serine peptidase n=1 Tax=Muricoccus nepalensis TaxID=1854500 RepID=UPI00112C324F|nr:S8 family serine peptidase [Roseomonas nepalensis]
MADGTQGGGASSRIDPVLRAATLALALGPRPAEFGLLALIPGGTAVRPRPGIRFGHAVREADGAILPPDGTPPRSDGTLLAAIRIDLDALGAEGPADLMGKLLALLEDLAGEGWCMQVERVAAAPSSAAMGTGPGMTAGLPPPPGAPDGRGVLVGAVDFGCAFAHPAFREGPDGLGGTRLRLLWDQNAPRPPGAPLPGRFYDPAELDALLAGPGSPYPPGGYAPWQNGYVAEDAAPARPGRRPDPRLLVHGTGVLALAAGRRPAAGPWAGAVPSGAAPGAALGFVHLRPRALVSEGDAIDVLDGACALFALAEREGMPAVVNLSIGANTGGHDGRSLMDRALDALLRRPGRAITVAAGNMRGAGLHRCGEVGTRPETLSWRFAAGDPTPNMLRVYAPMIAGLPALDLSLAHPGGAPGSAIPRGALRDGSARLIRDAAGRDVGTAVCTTRPPTTEAPVQHFELRIIPSGAEETWEVTLGLSDASPAASCPFDAWIERDDLRANSTSRFEPREPPGGEGGCSLGSLACAEGPVCVGACAPADGQPAPFSSLGGTRGGGEKPDLVAPGIGVATASGLGGLRDGNGLTYAATAAMDGTSAAAPQVAGVVALMLQLRPRLPAARVREILRTTTRERQADPTFPWDSARGAGRLDAAAALAMTMEEPE